MYVCIAIFVLSLVSYGLNKIPIALTSLLTMLALILTNCVDGSTAIANFGNSNVIIMTSMCLIAASFGRTSFVRKLVNLIVRASGGSFQKAWTAYVILAALLTNVVSAPMVAFSIVCPLAAELVKGYQIQPSKVMFPLLVVCVGCSGILPLANAVTASANANGYLAAYNFTGFVMEPMDYFLARWPIFLVIVLWAILLGPRQALDQPVTAIQNVESRMGNFTLTPFQEFMGVAVFFTTIVLLMLGGALKLTTWKITLTAALLVQLCGIHTEREAIQALNLPIAFIYVGAMTMAQALGNTGAGVVIGDLLASAVSGTRNNLILGYAFFIVVFTLTQLMFNSGVMSIFTPIALLISQSLGGNPQGLILIVYSGALTAFLTPMATPAISLCMSAGGYDFKSLMKQGWFITLLIVLIYPAYIMMVYPVF